MLQTIIPKVTSNINIRKINISGYKLHFNEKHTNPHEESYHIGQPEPPLVAGVETERSCYRDPRTSQTGGSTWRSAVGR